MQSMHACILAERVLIFVAAGLDESGSSVSTVFISPWPHLGFTSPQTREEKRRFVEHAWKTAMEASISALVEGLEPEVEDPDEGKFC